MRYGTAIFYRELRRKQSRVALVTSNCKGGLAKPSPALSNVRVIVPDIAAFVVSTVVHAGEPDTGL